jgi:hypothetical protein
MKICNFLVKHKGIVIWDLVILCLMKIPHLSNIHLRFELLLFVEVLIF